MAEQFDPAEPRPDWVPVGELPERRLHLDDRVVVEIDGWPTAVGFVMASYVGMDGTHGVRHYDVAVPGEAIRRGVHESHLRRLDMRNVEDVELWLAL